MKPRARSSGRRTSSKKRRSGIEQSNLVPLRERHVTAEHVLRDHAGKVDGVFRRSVWRRVSQLQFGQVVNGHPGLECGGLHVNAFVHTFMADGLSAEQSACVGSRRALSAQWVARRGSSPRESLGEDESPGKECPRDEGFSHLRLCTRGEIEQPQDDCSPGVFISGRTSVQRQLFFPIRRQL